MVGDQVKKQRGKFGEDYVTEYLGNKGYEIIARNYHKRCGEIDIIAKKDSVLHFVEVKTRKFGSLVSGVEAVNALKQDKIKKTLTLFLEEQQPEYDSISVDVAEVVITTDLQVLELNYYEDAINDWSL